MSKNTVIIYSANPPDYQYKHEPQWKLCAAVLTGRKHQRGATLAVSYVTNGGSFRIWET
uniref:Uncharacterized protein n=1 Tax=Anguilla anguilla TaxID=7936 RepID=A0A0E9U637_ANGAN